LHVRFEKSKETWKHYLKGKIVITMIIGGRKEN